MMLIRVIVFILASHATGGLDDLYFKQTIVPYSQNVSHEYHSHSAAVVRVHETWGGRGVNITHLG